MAAVESITPPITTWVDRQASDRCISLGRRRIRGEILGAMRVSKDYHIYQRIWSATCITRAGYSKDIRPGFPPLADLWHLCKLEVKVGTGCILA